MKNRFTVLILTILSFGVLTSGCTKDKMIGMPNPWTDCLQSYECAKNITGFNFTLNLSNYTVRAMPDTIEVTYPLDETREVTVRKTITEYNNGDSSGDYTKYSNNSQLDVGQGVMVNTRGNGDKINVMYFCAESGCYSARCENGMFEKEVKDIFNIIKEVEESKADFPD